jgi:hypothetical protein
VPTITLAEITGPGKFNCLGRLGCNPRGALSGLGAAAAIPAYDSQGFEVRSRAGKIARDDPDTAGSPYANPFWNVSTTLRLACANENAASRIEQVENDLKAKGYEVGYIRIAGELGRRGAKSPNDGRLSIPFVCALGNTNPNDFVIAVYKKGGTPAQAKIDVMAAVARLGIDLGDTGNWVVESFRTNVTDAVEKKVAAASQFATDNAEKVGTSFCGPAGRDCQRMVRNGLALVGALGVSYVLITYVLPVVRAAK